MAYEFSKSGVRVTVGTGHRAAPVIGAANGTGLLQQTLELIHDKSPLRMSYWRGSSDKLVVVFNGVGTKPNEYPRNEFFKSATNNGKHHALFVSDISRSWLNGEGIDRQIVDCVRKVAADKRVAETHLIGNSMGGTMALLLKDMIGARSVLSFVPQYSVSPDIVPEEKRWMRFRKKIESFQYPVVTLEYKAEQSVFILHGGADDELVHANRFPQLRGIRHFVFPEQDHNLCRHLKAKGQLAPMITAAIDGRPYVFRRLVEANGGMFIGAFHKAQAAQ